MFATSGKLVKIVLTNFMCHRHIEVTFHENVNVILGRNGSKSFECDIVNVCLMLHGRWKECDNGSHCSWARRKGNHYQQEYFIATVYTNWIQVSLMYQFIHRASCINQSTFIVRGSTYHLEITNTLIRADWHRLVNKSSVPQRSQFQRPK